MTNWAAGMDITTARLAASTWSDIQAYTPSFGNAGTLTYTTQTGWFFTAGKLVFVNAYINVNTAGTGGVTAVTLTLPTVPDRSARQALFAACTSGTHPGINVAAVLTGNTGAQADSIHGPTGGASYVGTDFAAGSIWQFQGVYLSA